MITLYYLLECAESYFERKGGIQKIIFWSVYSCGACVVQLMTL